MSTKCAKGIFSFLCVVFLCLGIALSVISLWTLHDETCALHVLYPTLVKDLAPVLWIIAAIGVAVAFISLVGVCGVIRESRCYLIIYFIVVLLTLIGLISCTIAAIVISQLDPDTPIRVIHHSLITSYAHSSAYQTVVDQVQLDSRCCGVYNHTDFQSTPWYTSSTYSDDSAREKVPSSCCNVPRGGSSETEIAYASELMNDCQMLRKLDLVYPPCPPVIEALYWRYRGWLIGAAVLVGVLMVVVLALACHIQARVHGDYSLRGRYV